MATRKKPSGPQRPARARPARGGRLRGRGGAGRAPAAGGPVLVSPDDLAAGAGAGDPGRLDPQEARAPRRPGLAARAAGGRARAREGAPGGPPQASGDDYRGAKKNLRDLGDPPEDGRHRRERLLGAVTDLAPAVGMQAACAALGVSRATVYRRRRPRPTPAPRPRPPRAPTEAGPPPRPAHPP